MSDSPNDLELLAEARQRVVRLLERAEKDRDELAGATKLNASAAGLGRAALKSVIAALTQMDSAAERVMQRKESP